MPAPRVEYTLLGDFRYVSGKIVTVYVGESDFAVDTLNSGTFELEWPRGSGRFHTVPELDDIGWFTLDEARIRLVKGQVPVMNALERM